MQNNIEEIENKRILEESIRKIGKSRIKFDEKEIETISKSKSFNFTNYLKKIIVLNRIMDKDQNLEIEDSIKKDYDKLLKEKLHIEINEPEKIETRKYKNIKAKTNYGLPFFMLSSFFNPKKLNEIYKSKKAETIVYKLDNEIERSMKKSYYFKTDKKRAESNAIINVFKKEFPKALIDNVSKASLYLDDKGITPTKAAAISIGKICESGIVSNLINKIINRTEQFIEKQPKEEKIKIKKENKIKDFAKLGFKFAAVAATIALVGHDSFALMQISPADLIDHVSIATNIDVSHIPSGISEITSSALDAVKTTISDHIPTGSSSVTDFLANKQIDLLKPEIIDVHKNMSLDSIVDGFLKTHSAITDKQTVLSAISEINDINNPNHIVVGQEIELPSVDFLKGYKLPELNFNLEGNKNEIINKLKDITIHYGETKSELIEKITEASKHSGLLDKIKIETFTENLNKIIPTDLKAYDEKVPDLISKYVSSIEKIKNISTLKMK